METVLYRKYRSNSFNEVVGQTHITEILRNSVSSGNVAHAYLLCGPRGTGKTTIARIMARAVNCEHFDKSNDVCNECEACVSIASNSSVDIIEMDAASNRGIEEIREIKDKINFLPNNLKYKVYIIDEAHMLTKDAFNALLKTLEEPPAHVIFILATTEAHKIPVTILSRVQRYDFRLATKDELTQKLSEILKEEEYRFEQNALDSLYKYSGGSFRDAETLLSKVMSSNTDKNITLEFTIKSLGLISDDVLKECASILIEGSLSRITDFSQKIFNQSIDLHFFLDQLLDTFRDLLVSNIESGKPNSRIFVIVKELVDVKNQMKFFNDKTLLLQIAFIKLCSNQNVTNSSQKQEKIVEQVVIEPIIEQVVIVSEEPVSNSFQEMTDIPRDEIYTVIVENAKKVDLGLSIKLETAIFEINEGILRIYVKHKHDYTYINNSERREKLFEILKNIIKEISALQVIMDKEKHNNGSESVKKNVDNSDIVEGIL